MINTLITIGKIPLSGLYPKSPKVDLNKVIFNGLSIKGIYGHEMYDTWCKMLAMFDAGSDVSPIISHRLDINDSAKGIEVLLSVEVNKVVFAVGE